jgi:Tol biopolymer transport system component
MRVSGEAAVIAPQVGAYAGTGEAAFSVSTRSLAYAGNMPIPMSELTWFERSGRRVGTIGMRAQYRNPALAPNDIAVAAQIKDADGKDDVWVIGTQGASRLTFSPRQNRSPLWSPDGRRITFSSYAGVADLYQKLANGAESDELLLKTGATGALATSWSSDGSTLVYQAAGAKTSYDLWLLPTAGEGNPRAYLQTVFVEAQAQISPDGRWMAYSTDETGTAQVWVQPIPSTGAKWQMST